MLAAMFVMVACDKLEEPFIEGAEQENKIVQFKVGDVEGVIDHNLKTVLLDFEGGTDVSNLTPTIEVSRYATVEPASGVAQDFTAPVRYTVTAMNNDTAQYMVYAVVHDEENEKSILSFVINEVPGDINEISKTVALSLPFGTDITQLVPTIEVSEGATVDPASGEAQDFTEPVVYMVTAINGTTAFYTVTVTVDSEPVTFTGKTVLIKDFTGARCSNCPGAAEQAHNLQQQLGEDHIFILSVHAGGLAQPVGQFPDFLTEEGTTWYGSNTANPLFTVDHVALTADHTWTIDKLDAPLSDALGEDQSFEVRITSNYNEATRRLEVTSEAIAATELDGDFYVTVCLVEDNLIGWQLLLEGLDREYVFHNVFRGTLNGAYGEEFLNGHAEANASFQFNHSIVLYPDYNADECYVLTYVYDKNQDNKILQTAMTKISL